MVGVGALFLWGVLGRAVGLPERSPYLDLGLGALFLVWLLGLAAARRMPAIPFLCWLFVLLILGYGWLMVANAQTTHEWDRGFLPAEYTLDFKFGPRSKDQESSRLAMIHWSAIFAGMLVVVDLARSRRLRRQLLGWLAIAGLAVAVAGIFQKASGTEMMWNLSKPQTARTFFAAFDYHGNAATLLNLCWPVAFLLWIRAVLRGGNPFAVALWSTASLFTFGALFANTSKAGHVMAVVLGLIMLIAFRKELREMAEGSRAIMFSAILAVVLMLGAGYYFFSLSSDVSFSRWFNLEESAASRLLAYRICWNDIVPKAGIWGYGPGTFPTTFAYFLAAAGEGGLYFWYRAHQDYLQLLIEWGWAGGALWAALIAGALIRSAIRSDRHEFYGRGLRLVILAVLLHAVVDFPFQVPALQWPIMSLIGLLWARAKG